MANPIKKVERLSGEALATVGEFSGDVVKGLKRLTRLHLPQRTGVKPLKRSKTGYEAEMFVLDSNGRVDNSGKLLALAKTQGLYVNPEASKGMIEVLCLPHHHHRSTSLWLVNNLKQLGKLAEKEGYVLYPFGTYPGKQYPKLSKGDWYAMLAKVLGQERFKNSAGTCAGYHQHYTLPRGLFDEKKKTLKYSKTSKVRRTLISGYNFMIAADPAVTCFLQSSPFLQGKYVAKDARMLTYRPLGIRNSKFARQKMYILGELPHYELTLRDLMQTIERRKMRWLDLMQEKRMNPELAIRTNALNFTWNPVKINAQGTFEYRGTDMNLMSNVFAVSTMIKFASRRIAQDFTLVTPMDIELKDAFKIEDNRLFIPPHTVVREELQPASAHYGLQDKDLRLYARRFFAFVKNDIKDFDPDYLPLLKPVQKMLDNNRTTSDEMIARAKRDGYKDSLPQAYAQELAIRYAERFMKDLDQTETVLRKSGTYD